MERSRNPVKGSTYLRTAINPLYRTSRRADGDWEYNPVCAFCRRAKALGYPGRSPPARAMADYLFKDHKPSARRDEARLRGLERIISSKTISPRLRDAKPACAERALQRWPSWSSAIGYRLSVIGYRLSVIGYHPSAIGYARRSPPAQARAE